MVAPKSWTPGPNECKQPEGWGFIREKEFLDRLGSWRDRRFRVTEVSRAELLRRYIKAHELIHEPEQWRKDAVMYALRLLALEV